MPDPLLSVVTPIYNCEKYLAESIESVLSQTFTDFEFIIINDGSVDGSKKIAEEYQRKDSRIRFLDDCENRKIPFRRNQAIKLARGRYIAIHDGDDISEKNRFELQITLLSNHLSIFCVGGWAKVIDENGVFKELFDYPPPRNEDCIYLIIKECKNPIIDPTSMFRKREFESLGEYTLNPAIYTVPDFDLWLRALRQNKCFANIQIPLIKYRNNPNGMTNLHKQEMIKAHMTVWHKFMRDDYPFVKANLINKLKTFFGEKE